jgi:SAM-dependent methyltransferase
MREDLWDRVANDCRSSWYLDPLVARQKRAKNLALIRRWTRNRRCDLALKTDLFEEANGEDHLLPALSATKTVIGMDLAHTIVTRARKRYQGDAALFLTTDVRRIGLASNSVDLIVSNSTLDHFRAAGDFHVSIQELVRILRPGGMMIVTLDNPNNPLYWPLRWMCQFRWAPFPLGFTTSVAALVRSLHEAGIEVRETDYLIHNPRLVSTAMYLLVRRILGRFADRPIGILLKTFDLLDRLPTRGYTACFAAVCGTKRLQS